MNLHIDYQNSGRYTVLAAAKSVAGLRIPEFSTAHNRASGFFVRNALAHLSMVAQAGASSGAPVSVEAGNANSVWATTNHGFASVGGSKYHSTEAANMATIPTPVQPEITLNNGRVVTSSLAVAAYFSKRHADVIRKIEAIECSREFTERNFALSENIDSTGRTLPCYEITRSGFMFLVMGFTGKKAAHLKENYINAFDAMESRLSGDSLPEYTQLLITLQNGVIVDTRAVGKSELVADLETFIQLAERRGLLVIHPDDLKSLSFSARSRSVV